MQTLGTKTAPIAMESKESDLTESSESDLVCWKRIWTVILVQEGQGRNTEPLTRKKKKKKKLEQLRLKYFFLLYFEDELQLFIFGKDTRLVREENPFFYPHLPSLVLINSLGWSTDMIGSISLKQKCYFFMCGHAPFNNEVSCDTNNICSFLGYEFDQQCRQKTR